MTTTEEALAVVEGWAKADRDQAEFDRFLALVFTGEWPTDPPTPIQPEKAEECEAAAATQDAQASRLELIVRTEREHVIDPNA